MENVREVIIHPLDLRLRFHDLGNTIAIQISKATPAPDTPEQIFWSSSWMNEDSGHHDEKVHGATFDIGETKITVVSAKAWDHLDNCVLFVKPGVGNT